MPSWDIILEILILLGAALVLGTIAEQFRQSAILGYLAAGTLVGPNVLGFVEQGDHVRAIAELGVALLLFTIGLEFSFRRLRRLGRAALLGGTLQVGLTMVIAAAVAAIFGLDVRASIAVGAMVALSSTACVLRLLTERGEIDSLYGRNVLGVLLLQDVAVIPLMLLVVILGGGSTPLAAVVLLGQTLLLAVLLVGALFVLLRVVVPRLLDLDRWSRNRDLPILLAIVLALGSTWAAHAASLSPAMGAFVAGVLLGESPFATQIRADIASLRTLLVTLFFVSLGMLGDPMWVVAHWPVVLGVCVLIVFGKALVVTAIVRSLGMPIGTAVATGLCIAQVGEFSFVLAEASRAPVPLIADDVFNLIVSVTILTLFVTPFLVAGAPRLAALAARRRDRGRRPAAQVADGERPAPAARPIVIIGFGPAGQSVAHKLFRRHEDRLTVIELNPRSAAIADRLGLRVQMGDATRLEVLEHAGVPHAEVIAITLPDPEATRSVIHLCRSCAPNASIVARSRYHTRRWELALAGAHEVVDEEEYVGFRIAAGVRRYLSGSDPDEDADGS